MISAEQMTLPPWRPQLAARQTRGRFVFEMIAVVATLAVGSWFVADGLGDFTNPGVVAGLVAAGFIGALLVLPLSLRGHHAAAAIAALVAVMTPAGFAYVPNLLMIGVAGLEVGLAIADHRSRKLPAAR